MITYEIIVKSIDDAILKCSSDGTTFPKEVSKELDNFIKTYGNLEDHEELSLYDNKGNLLTHEVGEAHGVGVDLDQYDNFEGMHVFHNHPTLFTDNLPTYLSVADMKTLLRSNYEGNNLLKSVTAVSPNGSRMTLIKTNDFDFDDNTRMVMANLNITCKE